MVRAHRGVFALPLPNSIWRKFTAVVENAAPGRAAWPGTAWHGTVRHLAPLSLLLSWRNRRSILLRPILFCIFGMCSPRRKSAATVWTVYADVCSFCKISLVQAMETYWHEDCLKCGCCDCRLGEVGNSLYTKVSEHYKKL